jgi:hypothetical protein
VPKVQWPDRAHYSASQTPIFINSGLGQTFPAPSDPH